MWRQRGWGCYTPSYALYTPALIIKQIARLRSVFTLSTVCVCLPFSHHDLIHFPSVSHIFLLPSFSVNLILYPQMSLISPSFCFPQSSPSSHHLLLPTVIELSFIFNFPQSVCQVCCCFIHALLQFTLFFSFILILHSCVSVRVCFPYHFIFNDFVL